MAEITGIETSSPFSYGFVELVGTERNVERSFGRIALVGSGIIAQRFEASSQQTVVPSRDSTTTYPQAP